MNPHADRAHEDPGQDYPGNGAAHLRRETQQIGHQHSRQQRHESEAGNEPAPQRTPTGRIRHLQGVRLR